MLGKTTISHLAFALFDDFLERKGGKRGGGAFHNAAPRRKKEKIMIPEFAYGRLTYNTFMTNMNSLTLWTVVWRKRESNPRLWLMRPACYLYTTALGRALSQPRPCSLYYRASSSSLVASTLPRVRHFRTSTEPSFHTGSLRYSRPTALLFGLLAPSLIGFYGAACKSFVTSAFASYCSTVRVMMVVVVSPLT